MNHSMISTLKCVKIGILLFAFAQILVFLPTVQGKLSYPTKTFLCGKYKARCRFPDQFCDSGTCRSCSPECRHPYENRPYGCEVYCGIDVKVQANDVPTCSTSSVKDGKFSSDCLGKPGEYCGYTCTDGYDKNPDVPAVACLSSGNWSSDQNILCSPVVKCPKMTSPNAHLMSSCSRDLGTSCEITCNAGYGQNLNIKTVWCLTSGDWTQDINNMCQKDRGRTENILIGIATYGGVALGAMVFTLFMQWIIRRYTGNKNGNKETPEENVGLQCAEIDNNNGIIVGHDDNTILEVAFNSKGDSDVEQG